MAVFEAMYVRCVLRSAATCPQVTVALGASLIAGSGNVYAPAVFGMTRRARWSWRLRVMDRAVMAV